MLGHTVHGGLCLSDESRGKDRRQPLLIDKLPGDLSFNLFVIVSSNGVVVITGIRIVFAVGYFSGTYFGLAPRHHGILHFVIR